jgi:hypothetical protein
MWLAHFIICLFKGHDCSELSSDGKAYTYCHRCGRLKAERRLQPVAARTASFARSPRPVAPTMPIDKIWR